MPEKEPEKDIHTAILAVMREIGYVRKTGKVGAGGGSYNFAGEADLIHALRPVMLDHSIVMAVVGIPTDAIIHETYQTKNGATMNSRSLKMIVRFTHAPSGTSIDVEAVGEGSDVGDKATPKAATGAYKYALRETFCIETGDDPDRTSSEGQERAVGSDRPRPPAAQRPAASAAPREDGEDREPLAAPSLDYWEDARGTRWTPAVCPEHGDWRDDDNGEGPYCATKAGRNVNARGWCTNKPGMVAPAPAQN